MPYVQRLNASEITSVSEIQQLIIEFNLLRQELDEMRANYNATLAKLDADAGVTDANYAALHGLTNTGSTVTAGTGFARRFTPT